MVMGRDSCSDGCGFDSQHPIYWMDIFHIYLLEQFSCLFEKTKINEKEANFKEKHKQHERMKRGNEHHEHKTDWIDRYRCDDRERETTNNKTHYKTENDRNHELEYSES